MPQHHAPIAPESPEQQRFANACLSAVYNEQLSRRAAFKAALAAAGAAVLYGSLPSPALAASASQETLDALEDAEEELAEVEDQLDELAEEFEALSAEQDETIASIEALQDDIDAVQDEIDATQEQIEAKEDEIAAKEDEIAAKEAEIEAKEDEIAASQAELEEKQEALGQRVSNAYKSGGTNLLTLLISSSSFEDLLANMHYADKVNESDQEAIAEIQVIKQELEEQKAELEEQKAELEEQQAELEEQKTELEEQQAELEAQQAELEAQQAELEEFKAEQSEQLSELKEMQAEISELVASLSDEVTELMEQRDEEYLAAVAEEEAQAAAAAAASSATYNASNIPANAQAKVVSACKSVSSPGAGYCAKWVSLVFQKVGFTYYGGNACDMYNKWCTSSNRSYLQTAMIIAVSTHSHTSAGRVYGHVGIYVGSSTVMDNVGYIRSINVDSWISYFGTTVTPRWGWIGGVDLSNS